MPLSDQEFQSQYDQAYQFHVNEDYVSSFKAFKDLAEQGYSRSHIFLGQMYLFGEGVEKNIELAEQHFHKAIEENSGEAEYNMARVHLVKKDFRTAIAWLEKSTSYEYSPAYFRLGWMYDRSRDIENDKALAFELFKKAAELRHLFGQREYAVKLMKGHVGFLGRIKGCYLYMKTLSLALTSVSEDFDTHRIHY